jgi:hypothetical protein
MGTDIVLKRRQTSQHAVTGRQISDLHASLVSSASSQPVSQLVTQPVRQPANQTASQSASQPVKQPAGIEPRFLPGTDIVLKRRQMSLQAATACRIFDPPLARLAQPTSQPAS